MLAVGLGLVIVTAALPAFAAQRSRQHFYAIPNDHLVIYNSNPNNRIAELGGTATEIFTGEKTLTIRIWDELSTNVGAKYQFENDEGDDLTNPTEPDEVLAEGTFCGGATLDIPEGATHFGVWVYSPLAALGTGCDHGSMGWIKMEIST